MKVEYDIAKKRHKNKTQLHWTRNNAKIESILGGGLQKKSFEGKTFSPMHHFFFWTRGKFPSAASKLELESRARSKCGISSSSFEVLFFPGHFPAFPSRHYLLFSVSELFTSLKGFFFLARQQWCHLSISLRRATSWLNTFWTTLISSIMPYSWCGWLVMPSLCEKFGGPALEG